MDMRFFVGEDGQIHLYLNGIAVPVLWARYKYVTKKDSIKSSGSSVYIVGLFERDGVETRECRVDYNFNTKKGVCKFNNGEIFNLNLVEGDRDACKEN